MYFDSSTLHGILICVDAKCNDEMSFAVRLCVISESDGTATFRTPYGTSSPHGFPIWTSVPLRLLL
jgi:hypothetical protein